MVIAMATVYQVAVSVLALWTAVTVESRYTPPDFCNKPQPWAISKIHPEFYVYTRNNSSYAKFTDESELPGFVDQLDADGLLSPSRSITFLVHGYMGYFDRFPKHTAWFNDVKDALLNIEDQTVFYVDWSGGSDVLLSYGEAASNTQPVAAFLAQLSTNILNSKAFQGDEYLLYLHCIGHSLGAHVCGEAGRQAKFFDRVSGLDPAGPGFENCTDNLHVDTDSAACVDNIHTDGTRDGHWNPVVQHFGTLDAWGHIDFYPNGGGNQPGCWTNDIPPCSHERVLHLFVDTIKEGPTACVSEEVCTGGETCPQNTQTMGFFSSCHRDRVLIPGSFYLTTGKAEPYC